MVFKKFFDSLKTRKRKKKEIRIMCELGIGNELGDIFIPLKENEPAKFKVGDRVRVIAPCDSVEAFVGKCGTVYEVNTNKHDIDAHLTILVEFDELVSWRDKDDDAPFNEDYWWCEEDSLELELPIDYNSLSEIEE